MPNKEEQDWSENEKLELDILYEAINKAIILAESSPVACVNILWTIRSSMKESVDLLREAVKQAHESLHDRHRREIQDLTSKLVNSYDTDA